MTPTPTQKAIEIAIENGWKPEENAPSEPLYKWKVFLDSSWWTALGKGLGWGILHCERCGKKAIPVRKKESDPEYYADCCARKKLSYGESSLIKWHRFIDHLSEKKDIDLFFKPLIEK